MTDLSYKISLIGWIAGVIASVLYGLGILAAPGPFALFAIMICGTYNSYLLRNETHETKSLKKSKIFE